MSATVAYPPHSTLEPLVRDRPSLVVFLRHFGCTFCREALADVAAVQAEISAAGVGTVFVHGVSADEAAPWFDRAGLRDVPRVSDVARAHYLAFGLETTSPAALMRPGLWGRGAACALQHGFSVQPASLLRQLPGVFVVHGPRILAAFRHRSPSDRPDYLALVRHAVVDTIR